MADNRTRIILTATDEASRDIGRVGDALTRLGSQASSISGLKGTLGGLTAALSAGSLVAFAKGTIDAADNINDLAQKTGIGVRALAGWQVAAESSGTSLEAVAKGVKGLGKTILDHGDALKAAGINATNANDALIQTADLFAAMPDGIEKTTLAVALFGKAGMDMIPMLNMGSKGLADAQAKAAAYADKLVELAPKADEFNDKLKEIEINGKAAAINGLLPMMDNLSKLAGEFARVTKDGNAFRTMLAGVADAAMSPLATVLGKPVNFFKRLVGGAQSGVVGGKPGVTGWDLANPAPAAAPPAGESTAEKAALERAKELRKKLGGGETGAKAADVFTPLMKSISEKTALVKAELTATEKLTSAEQFAIKVRSDIAAGYTKLDPKQKAKVSAALDEMLAVDAVTKSMEQQAIAAEKLAEAELKQINLQQKKDALVKDVADSGRQMIERTQQQQTLIGLREREKQVIEAVRKLEDDAAQARDRASRDIDDSKTRAAALAEINANLATQKVELAAATGAAYDYATSWESGVKTALAGYIDEVGNAARQSQMLFSNMFRSMEDALVDFVKTGKLDFRSLADSIISDLIRIQVQQSITKPIAEALNGSGGSLWGGVKSLFGGGRASGGAVDAGKFYVVGEKGPELLLAGGSGTVIPNGAAANPVSAPVTVTQTINIDARSDMATIRMAMLQAKNEAIAAISGAQRRGAMA